MQPCRFADAGLSRRAHGADRRAPFFRRLTEARKRPGTGLGLAIIERVVTGHQGTVQLTSDVGEGTTFTVWIPLAPPAEVG